MKDLLKECNRIGRHCFKNWNSETPEMKAGRKKAKLIAEYIFDGQDERRNRIYVTR